MLECLKMEKIKEFSSVGIMLFFVLCSCQNEQLDQKTMQSEPKNAVAIDQRENRVSQNDDSLEQYFIELISNSIQKQGIQDDVEFLTYRYPSKTDPYFWIKVGQSTPNRFQTEFNFVCHSKSKEVKYVNVFTGDSIDVRSNQWYKK